MSRLRPPPETDAMADQAGHAPGSRASAANAMAPTTLIVPVILSGGSGSRLWPVSRASFPKQLWPLISDKTMLQETALRGTGAGFAAPVIVCNNEHRFLIAEQLREAGIEDARIVLEPVGRNSAPALAAAALLVAEDMPDAVLWMMAADSAITRPDALAEAVAAAVAAAREGRIVTFGMKPTRPETGYGYIEVGETLPGHPGVHALAAFVEKPDAARARALLATGRHLWNSGMFVATAATMIEELRCHAPDVLLATQRAVSLRGTDLDFIRLDPVAFAQAPDISIDYAVAERTQHAAVVPADLGWSDVGSWDALWDISAKDQAGNVAVGDVFLEHASNCYVRSDGIVTAVTGLADAIVVVTEDAVLVTHRDRAQDVKKVVEKLRAEGRHEAVAHNRSYRPWGFYESLIKGDRFQVKRIVVKQGERLSLQRHYHRAEHWVVVAGVALVTREDEEILVRENESIYLPLGCTHRLENPGRIPLTLIEVQSGSYLGEDDIVRLDDTYNRT
jgi:mannose-1-phosphate guanylyltransferase/mannose-6-phosphate isomerase